MDVFNEKFIDEEDYDNIPKFNASDDFITDFKNRNNFLSKGLYAAKRPLITNFDDVFEKQMNFYLIFIILTKHLGSYSKNFEMLAC